MIEKSEIIELRLLQFLENKTNYWTLEKISNQLKISKVTVGKYLIRLKQRIDRYSKNQVYIESVPSKGLLLHKSPTFNLQVVYQDLVKELLIYSIIEEMLFQDNYSTVKFSLNNFVSVSSLRRQYKVINYTLSTWEMVIRQEGIQGDEKQIRYFYSSFYWQIFKGTSWPFPKGIRYQIDIVMQNMQKALQFQLKTEGKEELIYWLAVNFIRHSKGYHISKDDEIHRFTQSFPSYPFFS